LQKLYWKVCAIDSALKHSAYCAEQVAYTPVPDAPTNLRITQTNYFSLVLQWDDASTNEKGFKIYRSVATNTNFQSLVSLPSNTTTYTDTGLTSGEKYYYYVIATNEYGWFHTSNTDWARTKSGTNVWNITKNWWFESINDAISYASNGDHIQVKSGIYDESVSLTGFTNLMLESMSWASNGINTNTKINGNLSFFVFSLSNSKGCIIRGFSINGETNGIYITGNSVSNKIAHNVIYSNSSYGIYLYSDGSDANDISTNEIYGGGQNRGIYIVDGDKNNIKGNEIYDNLWQGIQLEGSAVSNRIEGNNIYNQNQNIYLFGNSVMNTIISNNSVYGSSIKSIYLNGGKGHRLIRNYITNNNNGVGIYITGATNIEIMYNVIGNQSSVTGIRISGGDIRIVQKSITNNAEGIYVGTVQNITNRNNNIYKNSIKNFN